MLDTIEKRGKVRTVFLLDPAERKTLEQLSNDTGAPVAELIRRSVKSWLQDRAIPKRESLVAAAGGIQRGGHAREVAGI